jgi:hypothetical protein
MFSFAISVNSHSGVTSPAFIISHLDRSHNSFHLLIEFLTHSLTFPLISFNLIQALVLPNAFLDLAIRSK